MIEVTGITKRYGDTLAVDDLSFEVRPGQVTGFLGPNGSGKSTTMRMIMGLDRPDAGQATVNGRPTGTSPGRSARSAPSSRPRPSTPDAAPATTSGCSPRPTTSPAPGSTRSSTIVGPERRGRQAGRHVLPRDGTAPRHRRRPARGPQRPALRRAGQRPRPRRDPLGPQPAQGSGQGRAGPSSSRAT